MRFRPLRPASAPDSALIAVADPPETMRAAVIDATGGVEVLHEASVPVPSPVLSELLVRVVAAGINPIDAKTRIGRRRRGINRVVSCDSGIRLQRHRREVAVRVPSPATRHSCLRHAAVPAVRG